MDDWTAEERRHDPGIDPKWSEWWALQWWSEDHERGGLIGGTIGLVLFPHQRRSWFWATITGSHRRLVIVVEEAGPLPRWPRLEMRSAGLWVDLIAQTPGRHMTLGLEAFGVALDDPAEARGRAWGERTPLGLDMEWESPDDIRAEAWPRGDGAGLATYAGYDVAAIAHGEVLVGDDRFELDGHGWRSHGWGVSMPDQAKSRLHGRLDDGTVVRSDALAVISCEVVAESPVALRVAGHSAHVFEHSLVRLRHADGRAGAGWLIGAQ